VSLESEQHKYQVVCILAAGKGTRFTLTDGALHKTLAPLGTKPVLTRIIEQFDPSVKFVVAVGHQQDQIRSYLALAHPDREFVFVEVENITGPGSGPGLSLLMCRDQLKEPFILTASDSIVKEVPALCGSSWMAVSKVGNPESFMTLSVDQKSQVVAFHERTGESSLAFVGLAGVADPETFMQGIENGSSDGELQVTPGFKALASGKQPVKAIAVEWVDTGSPEGYEEACGLFTERKSAQRVLTDVTYIVDDRVVKWFKDPAAAKGRVERAKQLEAVLPEQISAPPNWLAYKRVEGEAMFNRFDPESTKGFLQWAEQKLWVPRKSSTFEANCREFYRDKTLARLDLFLKQTGREEASELVVNSLETQSVKTVLERVLPRIVDVAVPSVFHGDLHEGNILSTVEGYRLIDWRDRFGSSTECGDKLYDLAKFVHTLELPETVMREASFKVTETAQEGLLVTHPDTDQRAQSRKVFWDFCTESGSDWWGVAAVDALVFINMAPLYSGLLGEYLYFLGRWLLALTETSESPQEREKEFSKVLLKETDLASFK